MMNHSRSLWKKKKGSTHAPLSVLTTSLLGSLSVLPMEVCADIKNSAVDFSATVHVVSDNKCMFVVTPPETTTFSATWTKNADGMVSWSDISDGRSSYIKVAAQGSADCSVDDLQIKSQVNGAVPIPNTGDAEGAVPFGSSGGYWVVVPEVSDVKLYTDSHFANRDTSLDGIMAFLTKSGHFLGYESDLRNGSRYSVDFVLGASSNNPRYGIASSGASRLFTGATLGSSALGDTTFFSFERNQKHRSVKYGISAVWGSNPIDQYGQPALDRALDGDTVNATFTMTVVEP